MRFENKLHYKTWIEISVSALKNNFKIFRKLVGKSKIFCVVKANAYGHGMLEVVKILESCNADLYAVDDISDALKIRGIGVIKPILVLGYTRFSNLTQAIDNNISLTVSSAETLRHILKSKCSNSAKIHIKVETGLNRQGVSGTELVKLVKLIKSFPNRLLLEGISTHYADIEDTLDPTYSQIQLKNYRKILSSIANYLPKHFYRHTAASAAAILYPETYFDAVRVGISLYGLWPSKETKLAYILKKKVNIRLCPVLSWKSIIGQVKTIAKGEPVGYGRTWYAPKKSKVAIVPIGYFDGFDRGLSNNGRVIVSGNYAPVIGRVAMNMIAIDISEVKKIKSEEEVIIIGRQGKKEITVEEIAQRIGTINYEVVSRLNQYIPRILVK
jgi:alanine racemase